VLTSTSTLPTARLTESYRLSGPAGSARSMGKPDTFTLYSLPGQHSNLPGWPFQMDGIPSARLLPSAAKHLDSSRPIPDEAPVIRTFLLLRSYFGNSPPLLETPHSVTNSPATFGAQRARGSNADPILDRRQSAF